MSQESTIGLFARYDRLVEIVICGNAVRVPENNSVLRCMQFVQLDEVSAGNYCWNGDCDNCRIWYTECDGKTRTGLACRLAVRSGMVITHLSSDLQITFAENRTTAGAANLQSRVSES